MTALHDKPKLDRPIWEQPELPADRKSASSKKDIRQGWWNAEGLKRAPRDGTGRPEYSRDWSGDGWNFREIARLADHLAAECEEYKAVIADLKERLAKAERNGNELQSEG